RPRPAPTCARWRNWPAARWRSSAPAPTATTPSSSRTRSPEATAGGGRRRRPGRAGTLPGCARRRPPRAGTDPAGSRAHHPAAGALAAVPTAAPSPAAASSLEARARARLADVLPLPGHGATLARWRALAAIGGQDLALAKVLEAHHDAVAILAQLEAPPPPAGTLLAVWAA